MDGHDKYQRYTSDTKSGWGIMNYSLFMPEFVITVIAFGVLAIDLFLPRDRKDYIPYVNISGLLVVLAISIIYLWGKDTNLYQGLFFVDHFSVFFKLFFLILGCLIILCSIEYVRKHISSSGEYYGILTISILGMMLMAASGELLTAYISLELLSFSLYVMVSLGKDSPKSSEASIKYILLGAFSSAIILFGISQIYGTLGTTRFTEINDILQATQGALNPVLLLGISLLIAGIGFKVAAVPFHMWAPDVYEGAPTPVTAYLAIGSKAAAFALILRLFSQAFMPVIDQWQIIFIILAAATMTLGNLVALAQKNIKRLLAYSSIGQVGYLLMGVAALSPLASDGIILHLAGYGITNLTAFLCIIILYNATGKDNIEDYAGLATKSPLLAMSMAIALFSLAGLPFFAGFTTKFYLFTAVASEGLLWLVGLAMINSLVSLYYYLIVIKQMYIERSPDTSPIQVSRIGTTVLGTCLMLIIAIGVYPAPLVEIIQMATLSILP